MWSLFVVCMAATAVPKSSVGFMRFMFAIKLAPRLAENASCIEHMVELVDAFIRSNGYRPLINDHVDGTLKYISPKNIQCVIDLLYSHDGCRALLYCALPQHPATVRLPIYVQIPLISFSTHVRFYNFAVTCILAPLSCFPPISKDTHARANLPAFDPTPPQ